MPANPPQLPPGEPSAPVLSGLARLLRPIARLMIVFGIPQSTLVELIKRALILVARDEFGVDGRPPTDSRISLLTGVHRKDVRRLRQAGAERFSAPRGASLGALVMARWLGSAAFTDANGQALALPRAAANEAPSFDRLVASVSTDMRPRTLLDEWLRLGYVETDAENRVHLVRDAFVPDREFGQLAFYFGRNLHDHAAAAVHNLAGESPAMLERSVHYDGLTENAAAELRRVARAEALAALSRVNQAALDLAEKSDRAPPARTRRVNFGVYLFDAPDDEDGAHTEDTAPADDG